SFDFESFQEAREDGPFRKEDDRPTQKFQFLRRAGSSAALAHREPAREAFLSQLHQLARFPPNLHAQVSSDTSHQRRLPQRQLSPRPRRAGRTGGNTLKAEAARSPARANSQLRPTDW